MTDQPTKPDRPEVRRAMREYDAAMKPHQAKTDAAFDRLAEGLNQMVVEVEEEAPDV